MSVRRLAVRAGLGAAGLLLVLPLIGIGATAGQAASSTLVTQSLSFTTSSGVVLHATVGGFGSLAQRPVVVEDSPYAPDVSTLDWLGPDFNFVELQWQGTGLSTGSLDAAGPDDQSDLSQFLGWACDQPWSNGSLGLYGFSASAIVAYDAMHLPMPCVKTAALMAGTTDLYRDLLYIGGILNAAAGAYVEEAIGLPTLENGGTRTQDDPSSDLDAALGFVTQPAEVLGDQTEDAYWDQRTFQGDAEDIPILADTSFYDVEPDGPFAAFQDTEAYGSHLLVCGAHDGFPAGTPGPFPQYQNWFEHYLNNQPLSAANQPVVSACVGNGSREQFLADNLSTVTGTTWPLTGTAWDDLYLSSATNSTVTSLNDGSLAGDVPAAAEQPYPFVPSEPSETDLHDVAVLGSDGLDQASAAIPALTDMQLSGPTSLTYTSPPLAAPLEAVGPAGFDVYLSSSQPLTDIYVVVADVWPDGTAYPVATGALRTAYPDVDLSRSLVDAQGDIVDPWNVYSSEDWPGPATTRQYHVEILPMGNTFGAGHRIRVYVLGTPADQLSAPPGVNIVSLGGSTPSRLILPSLDGPPQFQG